MARTGETDATLVGHLTNGYAHDRTWCAMRKNRRDWNEASGSGLKANQLDVGQKYYLAPTEEDPCIDNTPTIDELLQEPRPHPDTTPVKVYAKQPAPLLWATSSATSEDPTSRAARSRNPLTQFTVDQLSQLGRAARDPTWRQADVDALIKEFDTNNLRDANNQDIFNSYARCEYGDGLSDLEQAQCRRMRFNTGNDTAEDRVFIADHVCISHDGFQDLGCAVHGSMGVVDMIPVAGAAARFAEAATETAMGLNDAANAHAVEGAINGALDIVGGPILKGAGKLGKAALKGGSRLVSKEGTKVMGNAVSHAVAGAATHTLTAESEAAGKEILKTVEKAVAKEEEKAVAQAAGKEVVEEGTSAATKGGVKAGLKTAAKDAGRFVARHPVKVATGVGLLTAELAWAAADPAQKRRIERDPFGEVFVRGLCVTTPIPCSIVPYATPTLLGLVVLALPFGDFNTRAAAGVAGGTAYYFWKEGSFESSSEESA